MERCRLKICGLSRPADIEAANGVKPDYIGFVFAESRRRVSISQAALLRQRLDESIQAVGVFVNAPISEILAAGEAVDLIQLHGDENAAYLERLRMETDKPIIKAVRVESREQILAADQLPCDYLLLDTFVKNQYGGSGRQFDWAMIPKLKKPFFLAGGIAPENLAEAVKRGPFGIDVSSAAETGGFKDPVKMRKIKEQLMELCF